MGFTLYTAPHIEGWVQPFSVFEPAIAAPCAYLGDVIGVFEAQA